jgi:L-threonylcarbamoyladenylate synthase
VSGVPAGKSGPGPALTADDAQRLESCLAGDGVALIPTDTVYGLACNPGSALALRRIYELKRRPPQKPAAVMFFSLQAALATLAEMGSRTRAAVEALLPGPVTLLLANPLGRYPGTCAPAGGGPGLLGLRVPAFAESLTALQGIGVPAAQSSANFAGGIDPRTVEDVPSRLRDGADLVIDGGDLPGTASTVLDLSKYEQDGSWRIVREGPVGTDSLGRALDGGLVDWPRSCGDDGWFVPVESESTDSL